MCWLYRDALEPGVQASLIREESLQVTALLNIGQRGRKRAKGFSIIRFPISNVRLPLG